MSGLAGKHGVRIEYTRADGHADAVEVFVPGVPSKVQRLGADAPGRAPAAAPSPPRDKPRDWMDQVNAARAAVGLDSAEGSAKLREAMGEKFTLDAAWAWVTGAPGRSLESLMRAAAGVTLPPRRAK